MKHAESETTNCASAYHSRRSFIGTSAAAVSMVIGDVFPGRVRGQDNAALVEVTKLPRQRIALVSELVVDQPVHFNYPGNEGNNLCMIVRTGEVSGGGIGEGQDIVAFSAQCTHMGGSLQNEYQAQYKVAGPCRLHLTTFDLTRHGIVVAGHATATLPQIILERDGDEIFATGIMGLVYGFEQNDQRQSSKPEA